MLEKVLPEVQAVGLDNLGNTCGESWQDTIENGWEGSGKPGAFLFFYPEGRTYSPPAKQAVVSLPLVRHVRSREADCGSCGAWTRPQLWQAASHCPCSRRRYFRFWQACDEVVILPPHPAACLRQTCHRQLCTQLWVSATTAIVHFLFHKEKQEP